MRQSNEEGAFQLLVVESGASHMNIKAARVDSLNRLLSCLICDQVKDADYSVDVDVCAKRFTKADPHNKCKS